MTESVPTETLLNCTRLLLNKIQWNSFIYINSSEIENANRSEILELLSKLIETEQKQDVLSEWSVRDFIGSCLFPSATRPYELPFHQKFIWTFFFSSMLAVAITGNTIVLWIVLAHRRMRTVTNYFLLNLSIADLLMSSLNCIFNFIFMLNSDWPFGSVYCTINNFIANVSVAASVFTLVAISLDRYIAITRPLQHRTSRKKARIFLLIIWLLSCILAVPCLIYSSTMTKRYSNGKTRTVCYMRWPDGRYPTSMADYIYNVLFLVLTYGIPILIMIYVYTAMGKELWGSRSIGEHTERQLESMKSKKKVVRMFIIIVTIFAICWLPYHLFFVVAYHNRKLTANAFGQQLYLAFYWLAMSNAMVNPLIYYWMNSRFRVYFQKIVCFCCISCIKSSASRRRRRSGILMNKQMQSNSEQARSKSELHEIGRTRSMNWRRSTGEARFRHPTYRHASNNNIPVPPIPNVINDNNSGAISIDQQKGIAFYTSNNINNKTVGSKSDLNSGASHSFHSQSNSNSFEFS